jgi:hypothetical protein
MKKGILILSSFSAIAALSIVFSSCKEDEPPAKPKISIDGASRTVSEGAGTIEIEVELDKPADKDITVEYTLTGTAVDLDNVGNVSLSDYEVTSGSGEVDIDKGETKGVIEIAIRADAEFEEDETIIIELDDAGADAEITEDNVMEIKITNDDSKIQASINTAAYTMNEDDAETVVEIEVKLSAPAPTALKVKYELTGTARDSLTGTNQQVPSRYFDYYVDGVLGEVSFSSGQSSAMIKVQVYVDFVFEESETIIATLVEGGSSIVEISEDNTTTVTIDQQDGKIIALLWDETYTDVDMDMFLWIGEDVNNLEGILSATTLGRTTPQEEVIFIPEIISNEPGLANLGFGLSYVYYSGSADPMNFEVHFIDFQDGNFEAEAGIDVFTATYGAVNKNAYDSPTGTDPVVVQTFRLVDGVYTDLSGITVPASGSRMRTAKLPTNFVRDKKINRSYLPQNLRK